MKAELDQLLLENADLKQKENALNDFNARKPQMEAENQQLMNELDEQKLELKKYEQMIKEKKLKLEEQLNAEKEAIIQIREEVKQIVRKTEGQRIDFAYEKQRVYLQVDKERKHT